MSSRTRSNSAPAPWQSGIDGARANVLPGLALQAAALALVAGYYRYPPIHDALAALALRRERMGISFSILSTALCGGILPFVYLHFGQKDARGAPRYSWIQGAGLALFWAYKGIEVDRWYRLQSLVFGDGHHFRTIAIKVFCDQFGYCPILAVPVTAIAYGLIDEGLGPVAWKAVDADVRRGAWYRRRVLPLLISNLGVWIPAVAIVYALPLPLQLPLQNIVLCFYTLIVAHQTGRER